jgi:kumamolisin
MPTRKTVPLPGSEHKPVSGARVKSPISGDEPVEVRITLKAPASLEQKAADLAKKPIGSRQYLSRAEFEKTFGADDATIKKIEQFARDHNLAVSNIDRARNAVFLTGNVRDMNLAFQTHLETYEQPNGVTYRGRTGALHVPEDLVDNILSINGLDERPVATPKLRLRGTGATSHAAQTIEYQPQQVASLYSFPSGVNGTGECIAIIELGGGFKQADLTTYFGKTSPTVTAVSVDGGRNHPTGSANGPDAEVMLDIEVAGSIASGANIAVYFAPNTNKGFLDAVSTAVHDTTRNPSVISISWGSAEDGGSYSTSVLNSFSQIFQAASVLGITVLVAAGDNGSGDGVKTGNHVDFPASNPWVTACGGTTLTAPDFKTIQSETVWNDGAQGGATGGGVSTVFPVPTYQQGGSDRPWRARYRGRCGSRHRLQRARRWTELPHWRHQRGRASDVRPSRAAEPGTGQTGWVLESAALSGDRNNGVPRHHEWEQRRLRRGKRMGRLLRGGCTGRNRPCVST